MLYMTREERLLPLEKMCNTRDLGGYETQGGTFTKAHKYIRATSPTLASPNDLQSLKNYGINVVIDLRSPFEKQQGENPLKHDEDMTYYEVNLFDSMLASALKETSKEYNDLGAVYIHILETRKQEIKEIFNIFLEHLYDCTMFHCTSGKDRTGIISALLLDLAGCHEYDIVKDYIETYENNKELNDQVLALIQDEEAKQFLKSSPRYIMELLDYLREHYGSASQYLISIGIDEEDVDILIENFTI